MGLVPSNWIFLSKNGQDQYINRLAASANVPPTDTDHFDYQHHSGTIVLRGILKYKIMHKQEALPEPLHLHKTTLT